MSPPEPRQKVIHAPMIVRYKQFNPLCIVVLIPISQHYLSFVTAGTKVVLDHEYRFYINLLCLLKRFALSGQILADPIHTLPPLDQSVCASSHTSLYRETFIIATVRLD